MFNCVGEYSLTRRFVYAESAAHWPINESFTMAEKSRSAHLMVMTSLPKWATARRWHFARTTSRFANGK